MNNDKGQQLNGVGRAGQGLVEYLLLVCLLGVATLGIVSALGRNLREQYANVAASLRGEKPTKLTRPSQEHLGERTMGNFFRGSESGDGPQWE